MGAVGNARGAGIAASVGILGGVPTAEQETRTLRYESRIGLAVMLGDVGGGVLVTRAGIEPATL